MACTCFAMTEARGAQHFASAPSQTYFASLQGPSESMVPLYAMYSVCTVAALFLHLLGTVPLCLLTCIICHAPSCWGLGHVSDRVVLLVSHTSQHQSTVSCVVLR